MNQTGAVVLAAGMPSRMLSFKPMLTLGGTTLIRRIIHTLLESGIRTIVVVTGYKSPELEDHLKDFPVYWVYNPDFETCEMIDSARLGFREIPSECKGIYFVPCDVPLFTAETLCDMQQAMKDKCVSVVKPTYMGQPGHPILLDRTLLPHIQSYAGGGGLAGALKAHGKPTVYIECPDPGILLDADTPEDYEKMKIFYESAYKN